MIFVVQITLATFVLTQCRAQDEATPSIIHCPAIMCSPPYCRYGYDVDENGCPSCKCIDPCKNHECSLDEDCEVLPISCRGEPYCGTKVKCVKKCKDQNCGNISCTYGFERDCNNCPTCVCNEPCNNVVCPKYHYCMVERVNCYVPPCPSPYAFCESYCGENQILRNNYGELVTCTNNSCPVGNDCTKIDEFREPFCCSTPEE